MAYPYTSIWINGRDVLLENILNSKETARTDFERSTFNFIQAWCSSQKTFELTTSGSTGTPKKIMLTRDAITQSALLTQKAIGLQSGYNALVCLDTRYIAGQMMLVRCFTTAMRIVAIDPTANPFKEIPSDIRIDFAALVPYQVYDLVRSADANRLNKVQAVIIGGAPLDEETKSLLNEYACRCYATYGMTETISHIALQILNGPNRSSYFKTLPDIKISVDDRHCLVIEAKHLPEKVITNDIVELVDDNTFQWLGRFDNIINSGGLKVIPEKVETAIQQVLHEHQINLDFFITTIPDAKLGNKIVMITEGALPITKKELQQALANSLLRHEMPKEILSVHTFVRTETGKINRKESFKIS